jgi:predicted aspartyl protease
MRRIGLAFLGTVATLPVWADTTETTPPPADTPTVLSPPVIVEADEPRYVAPTLRDRIGRIWAPVMINGKGPYRLVLDTGANSSAIIPSVARSLGAPLHDKKVQLHGVTGSAIVPVVMADSMEVGDLFIDGASLPVVADVFGGAEGVLGPKGMADKRIFIDFGNDLIRIQRSRGQSAGRGYARMPLEFTDGQLPMFEIRIGGIRTKAILDTGAQITLGNDSLREALLRRKREGIDTTVIGVTLDEQTGKSFAVPTIVLDSIQVRNMRVTFGDMFIFDKWEMTEEPALLLGMDVIGTLDQLVIDYKMRELHMRPRR